MKVCLIQRFRLGAQKREVTLGAKKGLMKEASRIYLCYDRTASGFSIFQKPSVVKKGKEVVIFRLKI